jgi:ketosteroid isomerase-like protein
MKLTKKLESEVKKVYNTYWESYLGGDMETMASVMDEDIKVIGSTDGEVFFNKEEAMKFYSATAGQIAGTAQLRNRDIQIEIVDVQVLVTERSDLSVMIEGEWSFYAKARISSFLTKKENDWKFIHQHGSMPDTKAQEGEQVALQKISRENLELREAVKRRTTELENKNRELEIEAALERVRSRAMAMQTSEELNELIGTVFTELTKLDLVLTRCVILINEGNENGFRWWMANSEDPARPANFFVKYSDMPFFNVYLQGWHERQLKWQYILEGENKIKTDDFLFKETELSLLPDFVITGMRSPERVYLNASFNNFGNLTLASLEPLCSEHFDILLRFAKVFDLTYTRFNDLKQAETQAKDARIEAALERTRTQSMIMQHSNELDDTLRVFHEQVLLLGIPSAFSFLWLPDEKNDRHIFWAAWGEDKPGPAGNKDRRIFKSKAINYPLDRNEPATAQCLLDWKGREPIVSYHVPPSGVKNYFAAWQELIEGVEQLKPEYFSGGL